MKTTVVNKYKHTPTNKDIYIGRGSFWGNNYTHLGKSRFSDVVLVDSREEAIKKYEEDLLKDPERLAKVKTLKGHYLVCYCKEKACHGDVLAKYAEMPKKEIKKLIEKC